MSAPALIGLTGGIASGKSTVCAQLRALGATVIDADVLARAAVGPGTPALAAIRERWGIRVLAPDGSLDRAALRRIVFADARERKALEAMVHPDVESLREAAITQARATGAKIIVCDIPLLFEKQMEDRFDLIVFVDAPDHARTERLMAHRGLTREDALAMMAAQLPSAAKRNRADLVIDNDGTVDELRTRVAELWRDLQARAHD